MKVTVRCAIRDNRQIYDFTYYNDFVIEVINPVI